MLKGFVDFQVRFCISRPSQARRENALISRVVSAFSRDFVSVHDDKAESICFHNGKNFKIKKMDAINLRPLKIGNLGANSQLLYRK